MRLRQFTAKEQLLIIIRCPKPNAAAFHGTLDPKNVNTKAKTNATGTVRDANGHLMVSDYDMMSVWRYTGTGYQKIFVSALDPPGAPRGNWGPEAVRIVRAMNAVLISKIQHGCQDRLRQCREEPRPENGRPLHGIRCRDAGLSAQPDLLREFLPGSRPALAVQFVRSPHRPGWAIDQAIRQGPELRPGPRPGGFASWTSTKGGGPWNHSDIR